jgi:hypothetical protein
MQYPNRNNVSVTVYSKWSLNKTAKNFNQIETYLKEDFINVAA